MSSTERDTGKLLIIKLALSVCVVINAVFPSTNFFPLLMFVNFLSLCFSDSPPAYTQKEQFYGYNFFKKK